MREAKPSLGRDSSYKVIRQREAISIDSAYPLTKINRRPDYLGTTSK